MYFSKLFFCLKKVRSQKIQTYHLTNTDDHVPKHDGHLIQAPGTPYLSTLDTLYKHPPHVHQRGRPPYPSTLPTLYKHPPHLKKDVGVLQEGVF